MFDLKFTDFCGGGAIPHEAGLSAINVSMSRVVLVPREAVTPWRLSHDHQRQLNSDDEEGTAARARFEDVFSVTVLDAKGFLSAMSTAAPSVSSAPVDPEPLLEDEEVRSTGHATKKVKIPLSLNLCHHRHIDALEEVEEVEEPLVGGGADSDHIIDDELPSYSLQCERRLRVHSVFWLSDEDVLLYCVDSTVTYSCLKHIHVPAGLFASGAKRVHSEVKGGDDGAASQEASVSAGANDPNAGSGGLLLRRYFSFDGKEVDAAAVVKGALQRELVCVTTILPCMIESWSNGSGQFEKGLIRAGLLSREDISHSGLQRARVNADANSDGLLVTTAMVQELLLPLMMPVFEQISFDKSNNKRSGALKKRISTCLTDLLSPGQRLLSNILDVSGDSSKKNVVWVQMETMLVCLELAATESNNIIDPSVEEDAVLCARVTSRVPVNSSVLSKFTSVMDESLCEGAPEIVTTLTTMILEKLSSVSAPEKRRSFLVEACMGFRDFLFAHLPSYACLPIPRWSAASRYAAVFDDEYGELKLWSLQSSAAVMCVANVALRLPLGPNTENATDQSAIYGQSGDGRRVVTLAQLFPSEEFASRSNTSSFRNDLTVGGDDDHHCASPEVEAAIGAAVESMQACPIRPLHTLRLSEDGTVIFLIPLTIQRQIHAGQLLSPGEHASNKVVRRLQAFLHLIDVHGLLRRHSAAAHCFSGSAIAADVENVLPEVHLGTAPLVAAAEHLSVVDATRAFCGDEVHESLSMNLPFAALERASRGRQRLFSHRLVAPMTATDTFWRADGKPPIIEDDGTRYLRPSSPDVDNETAASQQQVSELTVAEYHESRLPLFVDVEYAAVIETCVYVHLTSGIMFAIDGNSGVVRLQTAMVRRSTSSTLKKNDGTVKETGKPHSLYAVAPLCLGVRRPPLPPNVLGLYLHADGCTALFASPPGGPGINKDALLRNEIYNGGAPTAIRLCDLNHWGASEIQEKTLQLAVAESAEAVYLVVSMAFRDDCSRQRPTQIPSLASSSAGKIKIVRTAPTFNTVDEYASMKNSLKAPSVSQSLAGTRRSMIRDELGDADRLDAFVAFHGVHPQNARPSDTLHLLARLVNLVCVRFDNCPDEPAARRSLRQLVTTCTSLLSSVGAFCAQHIAESIVQSFEIVGDDTMRDALQKFSNRGEPTVMDMLLKNNASVSWPVTFDHHSSGTLLKKEDISENTNEDPLRTFFDEFTYRPSDAANDTYLLLALRQGMIALLDLVQDRDGNFGVTSDSVCWRARPIVVPSEDDKSSDSQQQHHARASDSRPRTSSQTPALTIANEPDAEIRASVLCAIRQVLDQDTVITESTASSPAEIATHVDSLRKDWQSLIAAVESVLLSRNKGDVATANDSVAITKALYFVNALLPSMRYPMLSMLDYACFPSPTEYFRRCANAASAVDPLSQGARTVEQKSPFLLRHLQHLMGIHVYHRVMHLSHRLERVYREATSAASILDQRQSTMKSVHHLKKLITVVFGKRFASHWWRSLAHCTTSAPLQALLGEILQMSPIERNASAADGVNNRLKQEKISSGNCQAQEMDIAHRLQLLFSKVGRVTDSLLTSAFSPAPPEARSNATATADTQQPSVWGASSFMSSFYVQGSWMCLREEVFGSAVADILKQVRKGGGGLAGSPVFPSPTPTSPDRSSVHTPVVSASPDFSTVVLPQTLRVLADTAIQREVLQSMLSSPLATHFSMRGKSHRDLQLHRQKVPISQSSAVNDAFVAFSHTLFTTCIIPLFDLQDDESSEAGINDSQAPHQRPTSSQTNPSLSHGIAITPAGSSLVAGFDLSSLMERVIQSATLRSQSASIAKGTHSFLQNADDLSSTVARLQWLGNMRTVSESRAQKSPREQQKEHRLSEDIRLDAACIREEAEQLQQIQNRRMGDLFASAVHDILVRRVEEEDRLIFAGWDSADEVSDPKHHVSSFSALPIRVLDLASGLFDGDTLHRWCSALWERVHHLMTVEGNNTIMGVAPPSTSLHQIASFSPFPETAKMINLLLVDFLDVRVYDKMKTSTGIVLADSICQYLHDCSYEPHSLFSAVVSCSLQRQSPARSSFIQRLVERLSVASTPHSLTLLQTLASSLVDKKESGICSSPSASLNKRLRTFFEQFPVASAHARLNLENADAAATTECWFSAIAAALQVDNGDQPSRFLFSLLSLRQELDIDDGATTTLYARIFSTLWSAEYCGRLLRCLPVHSLYTLLRRGIGIFDNGSSDSMDSDVESNLSSSNDTTNSSTIALLGKLCQFCAELVVLEKKTISSVTLQSSAFLNATGAALLFSETLQSTTEAPSHAHSGLQYTAPFLQQFADQLSTFIQHSAANSSEKPLIHSKVGFHHECFFSGISSLSDHQFRNEGGLATVLLLLHVRYLGNLCFDQKHVKEAQLSFALTSLEAMFTALASDNNGGSGPLESAVLGEALRCLKSVYFTYIPLLQQGSSKLSQLFVRILRRILELVNNPMNYVDRASMSFQALSDMLASVLSVLSAGHNVSLSHGMLSAPASKNTPQRVDSTSRPLRAFTQSEAEFFTRSSFSAGTILSPDQMVRRLNRLVSYSIASAPVLLKSPRTATSLTATAATTTITTAQGQEDGVVSVISLLKDYRPFAAFEVLKCRVHSDSGISGANMFQEELLRARRQTLSSPYDRQLLASVFAFFSLVSSKLVGSIGLENLGLCTDIADRLVADCALVHLASKQQNLPEKTRNRLDQFINGFRSAFLAVPTSEDASLLHDIATDLIDLHEAAVKVAVERVSSFPGDSSLLIHDGQAIGGSGVSLLSLCNAGGADLFASSLSSVIARFVCAHKSVFPTDAFASLIWRYYSVLCLSTRPRGSVDTAGSLAGFWISALFQLWTAQIPLKLIFGHVNPHVHVGNSEVFSLPVPVLHHLHQRYLAQEHEQSFPLFRLCSQQDFIQRSARFAFSRSNMVENILSREIHGAEISNIALSVWIDDMCSKTCRQNPIQFFSLLAQLERKVTLFVSKVSNTRGSFNNSSHSSTMRVLAVVLRSLVSASTYASASCQDLAEDCETWKAISVALRDLFWISKSSTTTPSKEQESRPCHLVSAAAKLVLSTLVAAMMTVKTRQTCPLEHSASDSDIDREIDASISLSNPVLCITRFISAIGLALFPTKDTPIVWLNNGISPLFTLLALCCHHVEKRTLFAKFSHEILFSAELQEAIVLCSLQGEDSGVKLRENPSRASLLVSQAVVAAAPTVDRDPGEALVLFTEGLLMAFPSATTLRDSVRLFDAMGIFEAADDGSTVKSKFTNKTMASDAGSSNAHTPTCSGAAKNMDDYHLVDLRASKLEKMVRPEGPWGRVKSVNDTESSIRESIWQLFSDRVLALQKSHTITACLSSRLTGQSCLFPLAHVRAARYISSLLSPSSRLYGYASSWADRDVPPKTSASGVRIGIQSSFALSDDPHLTHLAQVFTPLFTNVDRCLSAFSSSSAGNANTTDAYRKEWLMDTISTSQILARENLLRQGMDGASRVCLFHCMEERASVLEQLSADIMEEIGRFRVEACMDVSRLVCKEIFARQLILSALSTNPHAVNDGDPFSVATGDEYWWLSSTVVAFVFSTIKTSIAEAINHPLPAASAQELFDVRRSYVDYCQSVFDQLTDRMISGAAFESVVVPLMTALYVIVFTEDCATELHHLSRNADLALALAPFSSLTESDEGVSGSVFGSSRFTQSLASRRTKSSRSLLKGRTASDVSTQFAMMKQMDSKPGQEALEAKKDAVPATLEATTTREEKPKHEDTVETVMLETNVETERLHTYTDPKPASVADPAQGTTPTVKKVILKKKVSKTANDETTTPVEEVEASLDANQPAPAKKRVVIKKIVKKVKKSTLGDTITAEPSSDVSLATPTATVVPIPSTGGIAAEPEAVAKPITRSSVFGRTSNEVTSLPEVGSPFANLQFPRHTIFASNRRRQKSMVTFESAAMDEGNAQGSPLEDADGTRFAITHLRSVLVTARDKTTSFPNIHGGPRDSALTLQKQSEDYWAWSRQTFGLSIPTMQSLWSDVTVTTTKGSLAASTTHSGQSSLNSTLTSAMASPRSFMDPNSGRQQSVSNKSIVKKRREERAIAAAALREQAQAFQNQQKQAFAALTAALNNSGSHNGGHGDDHGGEASAFDPALFQQLMQTMQTTTAGGAYAKTDDPLQGATTEQPLSTEDLDFDDWCSDDASSDEEENNAAAKLESIRKMTGSRRSTAKKTDASFTSGPFIGSKAHVPYMIMSARQYLRSIKLPAAFAAADASQLWTTTVRMVLDLNKKWRQKRRAEQNASGDGGVGMQKPAELSEAAWEDRLKKKRAEAAAEAAMFQQLARSTIASVITFPNSKLVDLLADLVRLLDRNTDDLLRRTRVKVPNPALQFSQTALPPPVSYRRGEHGTDANGDLAGSPSLALDVTMVIPPVSSQTPLTAMEAHCMLQEAEEYIVRSAPLLKAGSLLPERPVDALGSEFESLTEEWERSAPHSSGQAQIRTRILKHFYYALCRDCLLHLHIVPLLMDSCDRVLGRERKKYPDAVKKFENDIEKYFFDDSPLFLCTGGIANVAGLGEASGWIAVRRVDALCQFLEQLDLATIQSQEEAREPPVTTRLGFSVFAKLNSFQQAVLLPEKRFYSRVFLEPLALGVCLNTWVLQHTHDTVLAARVAADFGRVARYALLDGDFELLRKMVFAIGDVSVLKFVIDAIPAEHFAAIANSSPEFQRLPLHNSSMRLAIIAFIERLHRLARSASSPSPTRPGSQRSSDYESRQHDVPSGAVIASSQIDMATLYANFYHFTALGETLDREATELMELFVESGGGLLNLTSNNNQLQRKSSWLGQSNSMSNTSSATLPTPAEALQAQSRLLDEMEGRLQSAANFYVQDGMFEQCLATIGKLEQVHIQRRYLYGRVPVLGRDMIHQHAIFAQNAAQMAPERVSAARASLARVSSVLSRKSVSAVRQSTLLAAMEESSTMSSLSPHERVMNLLLSGAAAPDTAVSQTGGAASHGGTKNSGGKKGSGASASAGDDDQAGGGPLLLSDPNDILRVARAYVVTETSDMAQIIFWHVVHSSRRSLFVHVFEHSLSMSPMLLRAVRSYAANDHDFPWHLTGPVSGAGEAQQSPTDKQAVQVAVTRKENLQWIASVVDSAKYSQTDD